MTDSSKTKRQSGKTPPKKKLIGLVGLIATLLILAVVGLYYPADLKAQDEIEVYKSPYCGCCTGWVKHLEKNGFNVTVKKSDDMDGVKRRLGVPGAMDSCHTGLIGGYLVEGHVPAADIRKLLEERPSVAGIAAPGMPMGSPGMEVPGEKPEPYDVLTFTKDGKFGLFSKH